MLLKTQQKCVAEIKTYLSINVCPRRNYKDLEAIKGEILSRSPNTKRISCTVQSWYTTEFWECVQAKDDIRFLDKVFAWSRSREQQPETARPWARTRVFLRHWFLPGFFAVAAATENREILLELRLTSSMFFCSSLNFNYILMCCSFTLRSLLFRNITFLHRISHYLFL